MQPKSENELEMSNPLVGEDIDYVPDNIEEDGKDDESNAWDAVGD